MKAILFDIQRGSMVDGPGIRTVVFFKGCNLCCRWCHNPESQKREPVLMVYGDTCRHCGKCTSVCERLPEGEIFAANCIHCGKCTDYCPTDSRKLCGYTMDADAIVKILQKDMSYYRKTGGGVTFSGGECLLQSDVVLHLVEKCRELGISTAIDTAGHVDTSVFASLAPAADLFLYDVKAMDDTLHRAGTGVGNGLILENLGYLLEVCPEKVILRCPVIPGYNDTAEHFTLLRDFLRERNRPVKIELLPYHRLGENKYPALGLVERVYEIPADEHMVMLRQIVEGEPL